MTNEILFVPGISSGTSKEVEELTRMFYALMDAMSIPVDMQKSLDSALARFTRARSESKRGKQRPFGTLLQGITNDLYNHGIFKGGNGTYLCLGYAEKYGLRFPTHQQFLNALGGIAPRFEPAVPEGEEKQRFVLKEVLTVLRVLDSHRVCDSTLHERLVEPAVLHATLDVLSQTDGKVNTCQCVRFAVAVIDSRVESQNVLCLLDRYGLARIDDVTELLTQSILSAHAIEVLAQTEKIETWSFDQLRKAALSCAVPTAQKTRRKRTEKKGEKPKAVDEGERTARSHALVERLEELFKEGLPTKCHAHAPGQILPPPAPEMALTLPQLPSKAPAPQEVLLLLERQTDVVRFFGKTLKNPTLRELVSVTYSNDSSGAFQQGDILGGLRLQEEMCKEVMRIVGKLDSASDAPADPQTSRETVKRLEELEESNRKLKEENRLLREQMHSTNEQMHASANSLKTEFERAQEQALRLQAELEEKDREVQALKTEAGEMTVVEFVDLVLSCTMTQPVEFETEQVRALSEATRISDLLDALARKDYESAFDLLMEREHLIASSLLELDRQPQRSAPNPSEPTQLVQRETVSEEENWALDRQPAQPESLPWEHLGERSGIRVSRIWEEILDIPSSMFRSQFMGQVEHAIELLCENEESQEAEAILRAVEGELKEFAA